MSFTQEQMDAATAEAAASASATATAAERERISGIMGCDAAKTRPSMAMHLAFKTSMSVTEAGEMLAVAGEEKPAAAAPANPAAPATPAAPGADAGNSPFNAAMNNANHPEAGADAGNEGTEEDKATAGLMAAATSVFGDNMA